MSERDVTVRCRKCGERSFYDDITCHCIGGGIMSGGRTTPWISIPFADTEIEVKLQVKYHAAVRGQREPGTGIRLEPDEPAHYELESAWVEENGELVRVPDWMFLIIEDSEYVQEQLGVLND